MVAVGKRDRRKPFERDCDRVLYSTSFRRLAQVTQVISADAGHVFHNRLTHSLQVAQVGRRIAENLHADHPELPIDPDVVQAACLAHDLGHPPFGHLAEEELDRLARDHDLDDGFEGNAQSFRIVTRLSMGSNSNGLNLTRATLNAILKYPWLPGGNPQKPRKYGAYTEDQDAFRWAREMGPDANEKSLEAQIMDWADDVTYSVHDLDDFFRAGAIPLDRLANDRREVNRLFEGEPDEKRRVLLRGTFEAWLDSLPFRQPFDGSCENRKSLRNVTGMTVDQLINAVAVDGRGSMLDIKEESLNLVTALKRLIWHYVIKRPELATQQHGQRRIISELFDAFLGAATAKSPNLDIFPISARELLPDDPRNNRTAVVRTILDLIASLTEEQAIALHKRLYGIALGQWHARAAH